MTFEDQHYSNIFKFSDSNLLTFKQDDKKDPQNI